METIRKTVLYRIEANLQFFHQRFGFRLPHGTTLLGRKPADRLLDGVDCSDPLDHLASERRISRLEDLDEPTPRVCLLTVNDMKAQIAATRYETVRASGISAKDAETNRGAFVYPGFRCERR
jgi:hypothetical protein